MKITDTTTEAVILANGDYPTARVPLDILSTAPFVVCCDGGANSYIEQGHTPDIIIGDGDSLRPEYARKFAQIVTKVSEQESNDQTKAINYLLAKGKRNIAIVGATGKREDHTIGNISLLMEYARSYDLDAMGITLEMVSDYSTIFAITDTCEMECGEGRKVSIFSPDNSLRIKSEGLEWPTDGVVFDNWWKATLNRASQDKVRLELSHRSIALIMLN